MAGAPPGGGAPFDLSALSSVLNDPAIKNMAEQIASDPAFAQMTAALQESLLGGGAAGAAGGAAPGGAVGAPPAGGPPALDPAKYAEAMQSVMGNGQFLQMAEALGKQIMEVRGEGGGGAGGRVGMGGARSPPPLGTRLARPAPLHPRTGLAFELVHALVGRRGGGGGTDGAPAPPPRRRRPSDTLHPGLRWPLPAARNPPPLPVAPS